jgi:hypothetical protein
MSTLSLAASNSPNRVGAQTCTPRPKKCTPSGLQVAITNLIKFKFPAGTKAFAYLMDTFDLKERSAKHRLSNTTSYTIEELQALIQGEDGFQYLKILMADAEPKWWWWAKRVIATAERRRLAAELEQEILQLETSRPPDASGRRRMKGDLDARTTLNKKFATAETALGVLHQDITRLGDRAVAQAKGRRA